MRAACALAIWSVGALAGCGGGGDGGDDGPGDAVAVLHDLASMLRPDAAMPAAPIQLVAREVTFAGHHWSLGAGDYNSDGRVDLAVVTDFVPSTASVLLGDGDGGFATAKAMRVDAGSVTCAQVADLDGDGRLDLGISLNTPPTLRILAGRGDGTLAPPRDLPLDSPPDGLAAADLDNDGVMDVVITERIAGVVVLWGTGGGGFMPDNALAIPGDVSRVAITDLDGDARLDIGAIAPGTQSLLTWAGTGHRGFADPFALSVSPRPSSVISSEFNGDGLGDFAVTSRLGSGFVVIKGQHNRRTVKSAEVMLDFAPEGIAAVDLDGDGVRDLFVRGSDARGRLSAATLRGLGDGTFDAPRSVAGFPFATGAEEQYESIATGDFNGDGRVDLAIPHLGGITVLINRTY